MKIVIIGAGPGGYQAAAYAAQKGAEVTLIEKDELGGTCLNCGCIPTKTLAHTAEMIELLKLDSGLVHSEKIQPDFRNIFEHKNLVIQQLRDGISVLMQQNKVNVVMGMAKLKDTHTVSVLSAVGQVEYHADFIIVSTGSSPKMLPIEGIDGDNVLTSTDLLNMTQVPEKLTIIGAGVIGMEFASIYNSLGCQVTVIEYLKECLPALDSDIAKRLRKTMEKRGVVFHMKTAVEMIPQDTPVLVATGRQPNITDIGLEEVGIQFTPKGICTNENLQTTLENIYAIGDVNGRQLLAHAASMQGIHVINHIMGIQDNIRLEVMPAAIFTYPEAACVGPSEDILKQEGRAYSCHKSFYRANGKAVCMNETEGLVKIFTDADDRLIGCHAYGAHAADLIQEISVLMCCNTKLNQLHEMVHIHPTLGELLIS
jgi:dihydrolipoamide dehydrogenase